MSWRRNPDLCLEYSNHVRYIIYWMNIIEQRVLELIGENPDSPDVYADTDDGLEPIRGSISDAIEEIAMLSGSYKVTYHVPLQSQKTFYRLKFENGSMGWITDAWLVNQRRRLEQTDLIKLNSFDPRWMISSGSPEAYFQVGLDVVGFYRKPSGNTDIVELTCCLVPAPYTTSTERIKIRDAYQWATVHYAVSEWWASRGDAKEATKHFQMYADAVGLRSQYPTAQEHVYRQRTWKEPWSKATS